METINDISYYLNKSDFTDKIEDNDLINLRCVKRILVCEFEDYNLSKLIDVLSVVENLFVALTVGEIRDILIKTDTRSEINLYFSSFKHFVKSNVESGWSLSLEPPNQNNRMLPKYITIWMWYLHINRIKRKNLILITSCWSSRKW